MTSERHDEIFKQGYEAYDPSRSVYDVNPYNGIQDRGYQDVIWHQVLTFQPEATPFYNGWEAAKKDKNSLSGYSLFMDDFRFPNWVTWVHLPQQDNWIIARHYYDFVNIVEKNGVPRFITFDFDLDRHGLLDIKALPYKTGYDCLEWFIEYLEKTNQKFPQCAIHSANPEGSKKIYERIVGYLSKKEHERNP